MTKELKMIIDVSSILKELGGRVDVDCSIDLGKTEFLGGNYEFTSPVTVKGVIKNNGKSLTFTAECASTFNTQCARCGKEIKAVLTFAIDEDLMQNNGETDDEDVILFDGGTVEIDDIILNGFFMNENGKHLCSDDCKGLCPKCGCNLNEKQCDCESESIDPRWAALVDIMNNEN